jgi:hypothetical protein
MEVMASVRVHKVLAKSLLDRIVLLFHLVGVSVYGIFLIPS